jgi:hydroxylamine reductase
MFCFQCQETAKNTGCTVRGVCGKEETTANLQDLLIFNLKGIAVLAKQGKAAGVDLTREAGRFVTKALFTTITNMNFNDDNLVKWIKKAQEFKKSLKDKV